MSGIGNLRSVGKTIADFYKDETSQSALDVASKTQITIIVSIISIIVVAAIISPIFCRIEDRRFLALKFFLNVKQKDVQLLDN